jgi:glycosyltransferase involved in cell wall biosynthesis
VIGPLHVLILCYEYPPIGGGGGVGASQYAEAWAAAGHAVTVLTSGSRDLPVEETTGRLRVVRLRVFGRRERATATTQSMLAYLIAGAAWLLRHRAELGDVDVANTHFSIPTGPLGSVACRLLGIPNVLTIIGGDIFDPSKKSSPHRHRWSRIVNRRIIGSADAVIAISSDTRERAQRYYGIRRPIRVIPYGFSPPDENRGASSTEEMRDDGRSDTGKPADTDTFHLIAVGRLVRRKGFQHLLAALARLPPQVRLEVIGDGPRARPLRDLASELGVADRVTWPGFLGRSEILERMKRADVYVLSSLHEGLGIVVQEAMFAGLPIVATDNGGQMDLVTDGENGLLVPVGDAEAIADAVLKLMADAGLRGAMSQRSRERILELAMPLNAEEVLDVLREAIVPPSG